MSAPESAQSPRQMDTDGNTHPHLSSSAMAGAPGQGTFPQDGEGGDGETACKRDTGAEGAPPLLTVLEGGGESAVSPRAPLTEVTVRITEAAARALERIGTIVIPGEDPWTVGAAADLADLADLAAKTPRTDAAEKSAARGLASQVRKKLAAQLPEGVLGGSVTEVPAEGYTRGAAPRYFAMEGVGYELVATRAEELGAGDLVLLVPPKRPDEVPMVAEVVGIKEMDATHVHLALQWYGAARRQHGGRVRLGPEPRDRVLDVLLRHPGLVTRQEVLPAWAVPAGSPGVTPLR